MLWDGGATVAEANSALQTQHPGRTPSRNQLDRRSVRSRFCAYLIKQKKPADDTSHAELRTVFNINIKTVRKGEIKCVDLHDFARFLYCNGDGPFPFQSEAPAVPERAHLSTIQPDRALREPQRRPAAGRGTAPCICLLRFHLNFCLLAFEK